MNSSIFGSPIVPEANVSAIKQRILLPLPVTPISPEEWSQSKLAPKCIVQDYLYSDVATLVAAGGIGKTTLVLYEAIHIILGLPLYGNKVEHPGSVILLTAEDDREILVARLREISKELALTPEQIIRVQQGLIIIYVGGRSFKLCSIEKDVVVTSPELELVIDAAKQVQPALVVIDPAVSFGVGEQRVNDAEQGLIVACRRIRDEIKCCVRMVHHTGKANAREATKDQYTGRGGSAMADGSRMVTVINKVPPDQWLNTTGEELKADEFGLCASLPKLSYTPPKGDIYIRRCGYAYSHVTNRASGLIYQLLDEEKLLELSELVMNLWQNEIDPKSLPRKDPQSEQYIGYMVADIAELDAGRGLKVTELTPDQKKNRNKVKAFVVGLFQSGIFLDKQSPSDAKGKSYACVDISEMARARVVHSYEMEKALHGDEDQPLK
jgi:hypothetical protein